MPLPYQYSALSQFDADPDDEELGNLEDNLHLLVEDSSDSDEEQEQPKKSSSKKKKEVVEAPNDEEEDEEGDDDVFADADAVSDNLDLGMMVVRGKRRVAEPASAIRI